MVNIQKENCIEILKKDGPPIIVVAAVQESEAIINACSENGIKVEGVCDSFKEKTIDPFFGLNTFRSYQSILKMLDLLLHLSMFKMRRSTYRTGLQKFFSPLSLIENYDVNKHKHSVSSLYMKNRLDVCRKSRVIF